MENENAARKDRNGQGAQTACDKYNYLKSRICLRCTAYTDKHPNLACSKCCHPWDSCVCRNRSGHPVKFSDELWDVLQVLHEKGYETVDCRESRGHKWKKGRFHIAFGHNLPQAAISSLPEGFVYVPEGYVPEASEN